MKKNYYLIIGPARSGTTFIHRFIAQHPNVSALYDEINAGSLFFKFGLRLFTFGNYKGTEQETANSEIIKTLCDLNGRDRKIYASGCKIALHYAEQAREMVDYIQKYLQNFKIILVVRDDLVAQYGSFLRAHLSGVTHSDHQLYSYVEIESFGISTFFFKRYLKHQLWINYYLDQLSETHDMLKLMYEKEIFNFNTNIKEKIFSFLGLPYVDYNFSSQKKISPSPEKYIKNYDKLYDTMEQIKKTYEFLTPPKREWKNYYLRFKIFKDRTIAKFK